MFVNTPLACGCFFLFVFFCALFSPYLLLEFSKDLKKTSKKKGNKNAALKIKAMQICAHPPFVGNNPLTDGTDMDVNIVFQGLVAYGFRAKSTPRKINMVHLQITHEKQGK